MNYYSTSTVSTALHVISFVRSTLLELVQGIGLAFDTRFPFSSLELRVGCHKAIIPIGL